MTSTIKLDPDEERTVIARISTNKLDRDREVLLPQGAVVDDYLRNPVVLFGHDTSIPPVGYVRELQVTRTALVAKIVFAKSAFGTELFELFKEGILRAFSVSFARDAEYRTPTPADKVRWPGVARVFTRWPLLEISVVPVPANPEALAEAVGKHGLSRQLKAAFKTSKRRRRVIVTLPRRYVLPGSDPRCKIGAATDQMIAEHPRRLVAVISSDVCDKDDDILLPSGCDFSEFITRHAPVYAGHRTQDPPVGHAVRVWHTDHDVRALIQFADTPEGQVAFRECAQGRMRFSIAFDVLSESTSGGVRTIDSWTLTEISVGFKPKNQTTRTVL